MWVSSMVKKIISRSNNAIKNAAKLLKSSRERKKQGLFIIEGAKLLDEVIKNNIKISQVFFTERFKLKNQNIVNELNKECTQLYEIDKSLIKYISENTTPQEVICICKTPSKNNIELEGKILILENIQNPGNMGAIIRSAKAFGIKTIVLSSDCCDVYSPKVLRAAMGGVFDLNIVLSDDIGDLLIRLKANGYKTYASVVDKGAFIINKINFTSKSAVVIGNEGNGITDKIKNLCDIKFTLPINKSSESLNAAIAASIIMWEMTK